MITDGFFDVVDKSTDTDKIVQQVKDKVAHLSDGKYSFIVRKYVSKRSLDQNRMMWMWFRCIEEETGTNMNDVHDYMCNKFLCRDVTLLGLNARVPSGTRMLNTDQMTTFLNKVQAFAASELGIILPTPEDRSWADFERFYFNKV